MNRIRIQRGLSVCSLLVACVALGASMSVTHSTAAQAVRPEITAARPAPGVAIAVERWVESDRPRIAIHLPDHQRPDQQRPDQFRPGRDSPDPSIRIRDAITEWELLLLGLGVPYSIIGSDDLERGPDRSIDVLVMPAATWSDASDMRRAARFARSGGGVVVAGVPDVDTDAATILEELLGAEFRTPPRQTTGLIQVVHRLSGMPTGTPAGFRLNVAVRGAFRPADPITSTALGPLVPYGSDSTNTFEGHTAALRASPGSGSVFWTAFLPQDVSDEIDQQLAWQRLAYGALVDAGGLPTMSIEAWPSGRPAALGMAVLPSPGHDPATMLRNTDHLIDMLEREELPATFFLPGSEIGLFPDVVRRIHAIGEFGTTTRSGRPLAGQSSDVQRSRIREGRGDLRAATDAASIGRSGETDRPGDVQATGFLPPAWLFDGSTLQAVADEGFEYMLRTGGSSLMPDSMAVHDQVDFRAADSPRYVRTLPVNESFGSSAEGNVGELFEEYREAYRAGGLFVLPFRVEENLPGSARFDTFLELIARVRRDATVFMSLGEVSAWDAARRAIRVDVREGSRKEVVVTLVNTGDDAVSDLVLRWDLGRSAERPSVNVSDPRVRVETDPATVAALLFIPDLASGSTMTFRITRD